MSKCSAGLRSERSLGSGSRASLAQTETYGRKSRISDDDNNCATILIVSIWQLVTFVSVGMTAWAASV